MKKSAPVIVGLIFSMMLSNVSAAVSGMKDVESVGADKIIIDIPVKEGYNTIEGTDFDVDVKISSASKNGYYDVECKVDSEVVAKETVYVQSDSTVSKKVHVSNMKQGVYNLSVNVNTNGTTIATKSVKAAVIRPYEGNVMDVFTQRGLCGYGMNDKYYFTLSGLNNFRTGSYNTGTEWQQIEKTKGVYDFDSVRISHKAYVDDDKFTGVWGTMYNNPLYNGMSEWPGKQYGPTTKVNFDGYAKYAAASANAFPNMKYIELYNEPNIFYWKPEPNVQGYVQMCEVTHRELKKTRDDVSSAVGVMAGGNYTFFKNMTKYDIYGNMDCLSYHPYIYPNKVDKLLQEIVSGMNDIILIEGGWKETITTEAGWPTHKGTNGSTQTEQAIESVKYFIVEEQNHNEITELYCMGSGPNESLNEDNFGIIDYQKVPKPVYIAIKELNQRTSGGFYAGKIQIADGVSAHMYVKDNKLTVVAWKNKDYDKPYLCEQWAGVSAYDMYGNSYDSSKGVLLGEQPTYIEGLPMSWLYNNVKYNMKSFLDAEFTAIESYVEGIESIEGYSQVKDMLYDSADNLNISENPTEEELLNAWEEFYSNCDKIIDMYKDGSFKGKDTNVSSLLFVVNLTSDYIAKAYMTSCEKDMSAWKIYEDDTFKKAVKTVDKAKEDSGMRYSEAMLKFARNYHEKIEKMLCQKGTSSMKTGIAKMWNEYVKLISNIAEKMSEIEQKRYDNIILQLPESESTVELNVKKTIYASLYNYTPRDLSGTVELLNPNGEVVSKSDVSLAKDKSTQVPLELLLNEVNETEDTFTLRYSEKGKELKTSIAPVKVLVSMGAIMSIVETEFDNINEVGIDFSNYITERINGTVKIEPPEGWELTETEKPISISPDMTGSGQVTTVKFGVSKKTQTKFNFYNFGITVTSSDGRVIFKKKIPLSFTNVVKADREYYTEDFDGNIDDWQNAYPIYIGQPEDASSLEAWQEQTAAARSFVKWDENYLYFLIDVADDVHMNSNDLDSNIYNGDCIQLALDVKNVKRDYEANCYEYGFAKTDAKGIVNYSWYTPGRVSGKEPSEYASIIRDNSLKLTRYLIKLPLSSITPMSLSEGTKFGYNVILNDGDFLGRDRFLSYAYEYKTPSYYPNFVLRGKETLKSNAKDLCPIPSNLSQNQGDDNEFDVAFDDISGHWAENKINKFAKEGFVVGDGKGKFMPDKKMTRAEFISMISNAFGIGNKIESSKGLFGSGSEEKKDADISYFDVSPKAWFSQAIADVKNAGFIDKNIAEVNFYPNEYIKREEACDIIYKYIRSKGETGENKKSLIKFSDAVYVSEWAEDGMMDLYGLGIIKGDGNGNLNPKSVLTRAEAVTMLHEVLFR